MKIDIELTFKQALSYLIVIFVTVLITVFSLKSAHGQVAAIVDPQPTPIHLTGGTLPLQGTSPVVQGGEVMPTK